MSFIRNLFAGRNATNARLAASATSRTGRSGQNSRNFNFGRRNEQRQDHAFEQNFRPHTDEVVPFRETIKTLQNRVAQPASFLGLKITWDHHHKHAPERLVPTALHTLGFTKTERRSRQILKDLEAIGVTDGSGVVYKRVLDAERLVNFYPAMRLGGRRGLNAEEKQGLRIYLTGFEENLQNLGKNIANLPVQHRRGFLFYAGVTESSAESEQWADYLKKMGVLDRHYLPLNGGARFEDVILAAHHNTPTNSGSWNEQLLQHRLDKLETIRSILFPLPTYSRF